ncbi:DNA-3-methyladenine glycosylase [Glaciibacter superstes]|uniref:DNA-3-methyladenine glycosylase n=1 Tax=Glaciibacter superstes TaxID=501023 RepID=UPI0003B38DE6|nr:DNA-3-methyladenine glycosylase [Glaciibacter superstes]
MTFDRTVLERGAVAAAPLLLGAILTHRGVSVRITELEAYVGGGVDPGSHAHRGKTNRNASMFGPPGHLYAYFTYGMHTCANIVCSPDGTASGVLVRAGEVVDGVDVAHGRRPTSKKDRDLARGPALLTLALGISLSDNGADLNEPPFDLEFPAASAVYETGPRTGLSGEGGTDAFPWRFWIPGEPSVSPYKRHPKLPR